VLPSKKDATYKFPFKEKYEKREGLLTFTVNVRYGIPGKPPSRNLIHTAMVPFKPRGVVTFSDCYTQHHEETAI
jgi:hypothetical protein